MMEAKRRGRKRCRAHNRERHHHRHHYRTSDESGKSCASNCDGQLGGEASATDGFDAERSGSDCSNAACSLRLETAMDTYGMLQRQRQQVETKERQHRLRNEACALTAEAVKDAPQRHTVNRHGHRDVLLKAAASCGPVSGSTRAAALPGVSVDCVSVQLPLRRGKQTALCATGSRSPSTVATAGSTGCPRVGRQGWHLSSTHTPAFASAQRAACVSRGDVSALAQTLRSRSTGDWSEWSTSTTAQGEAPGGAAMIEVAVDAHRCHRDNASAGSRNTEDDEQAAPADMPLFQDTSESLTYPFASPTAGGATTFSSASCMAAKCGLPTRALWDTDSFFARRAAAPSMMQFDAADHPRDWSLQCSSASQNPQYFSARGGEDTNLWAVPLVEEERWPDAASPLAPPPPTGNAIPSQTMPSNWPLPPATSVSAKRFPWNMEPGGMGGAPALEIPCEHQHTAHPSFTPPSSFPWLAPSLSPQNASSGDLRRYESRELPDHGGVWLIQPPASLPFGSSVLPDVPTATADAASNSAFPRGVLPWVPAPPRDDAHQQHNSPWLSQHHSQLPQEGVRPHFLPPAPQLQRHTPSLGEARRTGSSAQRGGAGQQRRQRPAPLRALNRTTERCRRFWERCRHPPDSHPAPSP
ncbi:hypothetical protein ABL78_2281 [Leptomonas seymouri]|uniref:Uncharacterized protein n=1 Tax=Leptomonas seymouri TaxID=5684 RepID=A0A0N1IM01_LEPSE|nr:hypothetical protein ABL78_2281 [Leptomonas seymouri]|eukprot:KPI88613.1 hypothetical protein ABL78_2281 [Leptomonas seymouri]